MDLKESKNKKSDNRHPWELARFRIVNDQMAASLRQINETGGTVLDMGCGDTWFVERLSDKFPSIRFVAVDIAFSAELLADLRQKYTGTNISVYPSLDEAVQNQPAPFDLILLLDVIEHIENDITFLQWMQTFSQITSSTEFCITVPAYQWLFTAHDRFLDHYRRYNNSLLVRNCATAGLKTDKVGYFFFSLYLARILAWGKEKMGLGKKETTGLVEWTTGKGLTSFIEFVLMADYRITNTLSRIGIKLPGLSNFSVCRKSA